MTMRRRENELLLAHFSPVLLDFDYVVEIGTVNDDDRVDSTLDLVSIYRSEVDADDHRHYHCFWRLIEWISCEHPSWRQAMVFYHYV